jgi:hypothetical protein
LLPFPGADTILIWRLLVAMLIIDVVYFAVVQTGF